MIEIEKKFHLKPGDEERLLAGAEVLKTVVNTDTYWDTDDYRLSSKDTWLRQRNGKWELKVPLHEIGHHKHVVEQYHEIETDEEIRLKLMVAGTGSLEEDLRATGFAPFATVVTTRRKYTKDGFHIDLDEADFGYTLCEIEYMIPDDGDKDTAARELIAFAQKQGLTYSNHIHGKMIEYLYRFRPEHYRALQESGVLWQTNET